MQNHIFIVFICLYSGRRRLFPASKRPKTQKHIKNHIFTVFICLYNGRRRLFPASKRPKTSKTVKNHRKAVKTGSKPGARGARGTPRGRPGLKVPGSPPLKSPALGLLVPGDPHTLPEGVISSYIKGAPSGALLCIRGAL